MKSLTSLPDAFPEGEAHFFIPGPTGRLETITLSAATPLQSSKGVAVICHPHPLKEGTMHNKVVHTLSRAFVQKGIDAVRFNYRGVGESEGTFGNSIGETADLISVLRWIDAVHPHVPIYLAGFSFGCYIAAMGATQHTCHQLFSIAPAVNHQPFDQLPPIQCPWLVIQGENDEVVPPEAVYTWFERAHQTAQAPMECVRFPDTSHFFHSKLILLRETIGSALLL
jgi:alpha/beta superfamily hydrolase